MRCPLCGSRKARRACPALNKDICQVCCGTKRLIEIACPSTCGYLAAAREHPAAVVRRQQERDVALLLPTVQNLTERQYQLFFLFQTAIVRHQPDGLARLLDDDVAEAAEAVAKTLETAERGVIYEHAPQSVTAARLAAELKTLLAGMRQKGAKLSDREVAVAFRAIEHGARHVRQAAPGGETAYLTLMARLIQQGQAPAEPERRPADPPLLILP
jgi:hypothetical protein